MKFLIWTLRIRVVVFVDSKHKPNSRQLVYTYCIPNYFASTNHYVNVSYIRIDPYMYKQKVHREEIFCYSQLGLIKYKSLSLIRKKIIFEFIAVYLSRPHNGVIRDDCKGKMKQFALTWNSGSLYMYILRIHCVHY